MLDCFLSYICVEEVGGWRRGFFVETGWGGAFWCIAICKLQRLTFLLSFEKSGNAVSGGAAVCVC